PPFTKHLLHPPIRAAIAPLRTSTPARQSSNSKMLSKTSSPLFLANNADRECTCPLCKSGGNC
ncbi:hypothetical protein IW140_004158, partial [Coemansia sp. RSA 1813]